MDSNELDLDILGLTPEPSGLRHGPGRQASPVSVELVRDLTEADLAMPVKATQSAPSIKSLRDTHHALARVLATGASEAEASAVTGYSPSRISILKADPTFRELLEFYRGTAEAATADMAKRMADVGLNALAMLQEQMEDAPEKFTPGTLREIARDMADRTGHSPQRGPSTVVNNLNVQLSERMANARARVAAIAEQRLPIPVTPSDIDHE